MHSRRREKASAIPPREICRLRPLVDVLEKRSFMACHTYVQSETNMIMRLADEFGIVAHTLIHMNEGYKVADITAEHGAAGSVCSVTGGHTRMRCGKVPLITQQ
jgi:hypothetical protein